MYRISSFYSRNSGKRQPRRGWPRDAARRTGQDVWRSATTVGKWWTAPTTERNVEDGRVPPYCLRRPAEGPRAGTLVRGTCSHAGWTDCDERALGRRGVTDQIRAPCNRDPREAEAGPLVASYLDYLALQPPPGVHGRLP